MRIPKIYHFGSLSSVPEGEANCILVCLTVYANSNLQNWLAVRERHDKAQPTPLNHVPQHSHSLMFISQLTLSGHCILPVTNAGKGQGKGSFIVMEYLNFGGSYSQADLGRALAEMHKAEPAVNSSPGVLNAQHSLLTA